MASATIAAPRPIRATGTCAMEMESLVSSSDMSFSSSAAVASSSNNIADVKPEIKPDLTPQTPAAPPSSLPLFPSTPIKRSPSSNPQTPSRPPSRTERRFVCPHPGCDKAYTKPSRLTEHQLQHTGQRPHVCGECGKSYLRSTHLAAHVRTHKNPDDKAFACSRAGCDKKFWTATHLRRHEILHDATEAHPCSECGLVFPKTHFLREHTAAAHGGGGSGQKPETKPFVCAADGCGMAFAMRQQLKTHEKIHDATRYTCSHPSHGDDMPTFPVWSALQTHIKDAHPPTCPFAECEGRTFKNPSRLRDHLKVHEQREVDLANQSASDTDLPPVIAEGQPKGARRKRRRSERTDIMPLGDNSATDPHLLPCAAPPTPTASPSHPPTSPGPPRKLPRLLSGETGKDWPCGAPACGKTYKSKFARDEHAQAAHTRARHRCPTCARAYRRPASLKRHLAEAWCGANSPRPKTPKTPRGGATPAPAPDEGALLTGTASLPGGSQYRRWACPFVGEPCGLRFHRVYDVRRHLAAAHEVEVEDMGAREMLLADGQTGEE